MKQIDYIRLLQKIAIAANEATAVEKVLQICLDEVCALTKWPVGHVYFHHDDAPDAMASTRIWHLDDPEKFASFKKVTEITSFEAGVGLPGRVYASGEPAWIPDVNKDPNFPRAELSKNIRVKAGFAFPVKVDGKVAAVLEFYSPRAVSPNQELLDVMVQVGEQLSHVIKRNRTENEMQQHAAIINQIQDAVITTDMEGIIRSWNKGAEEQLGYTAAETIGKHIGLVYLRSGSMVDHSAIIDALIEKGRIGFETAMRRKSGVVFPAYLSQSLNKDARGTITGIIYYSSDITQQKQAEAVLEQAKVIDQIHDAMIGTDLEGHITLWNRGAECLFGYSAIEILGKAIYQLYPKEETHIPSTEFIEIIKNKGSFEVESLMRKKSGEDIYVHNALSALTDEKENVTGVISYAMDISGRKRAEEELRNYEKIVSASNDLVAILNGSYIVEACNEQFLVYRNKERDEVIGKHVSSTNEAGYFDNSQKKLLDRCLAGETVRLQHWRNYEGTGKRYMDQQYSPFTDAGGKTKILAISRDITDLKQAEEELRNYEKIVSASKDSIAILNADYIVEACNPQYLKYRNKKRSEVVGKHLAEINEAGYFDNVQKDIVDRCIAGEMVRFQHWRQYEGSDRFYFDVQYTPYTDPDTNEKKVVATARDITALKLAEEELQQAHQRLTYHTEYSPLAVIEWDKDYRARRWTKRAKEMFGWTSEDVIGKTPDDWQFVYDEDKEIAEKIIEPLFSGKSLSGICINRNNTKDGKIVDCEWYNSVLLDDNGNVDSVLSLAHDITERKQAEKELQLLNQRLTLHLENSPLGMLEMDRDYRVLSWSKQAEQLFGWKENEVIGRLLSDIGLVYDEDMGSVGNKLSELAEGKIHNLVNLNRNYTKDGKVLDCEWYNSAVVDENGELVSILSLAHDITERKKAETERLIFEQLISASADFMAVINDKYEFDAVNQQYCDAIGKTRDEIIGTHVHKIVGRQQYTEQLEPILNKCFTGEPVRKQSWQHYPIIGRRYTDVLYTRFQDKTSGEYKVATIARDITELRQAEEELHRYERMVSASKDPMVLINKDYIIEACNPQYCEMRGVRADDILGKHIDVVNKGDYFKDRLKDILDRCLSGETVRFQHWRKYPALEGNTYMDLQFVPHRDEDTDAPKILAMGRDITDLKQAEIQLEKYQEHLEELVEERTKELKAAQEELVQKERLAVLGTLIATVSHELRNPLGTIYSSLYTIATRTNNANIDLGVVIERANRNIRRCVDIIEQLLDYTRISHSDMTQVNLDEWIAEILDEYEFQDEIIIKRELNTGISVECARENIRRCIINVITNACQAMMDDANLDKNKKTNELLVKTSVLDSKFIIEISDTGVGIAEEEMDHIFEPLFSTKIYGVGLGLPIIMQIMEQHRGGVEVSSVENEGAQVKLWLPLSDVQLEIAHE